MWSMVVWFTHRTVCPTTMSTYFGTSSCVAVPSRSTNVTVTSACGGLAGAAAAGRSRVAAPSEPRAREACASVIVRVPACSAFDSAAMRPTASTSSDATAATAAAAAAAVAFFFRFFRFFFAPAEPSSPSTSPAAVDAAAGARAGAAAAAAPVAAREPLCAAVVAGAPTRTPFAPPAIRAGRTSAGGSITSTGPSSLSTDDDDSCRGEGDGDPVRTSSSAVQPAPMPAAAADDAARARSEPVVRPADTLPAAVRFSRRVFGSVCARSRRARLPAALPSVDTGDANAAGQPASRPSLGGLARPRGADPDAGGDASRSRGASTVTEPARLSNPTIQNACRPGRRNRQDTPPRRADSRRGDRKFSLSHTTIAPPRGSASSPKDRSSCHVTEPPGAMVTCRGENDGPGDTVISCLLSAARGRDWRAGVNTASPPDPKPLSGDAGLLLVPREALPGPCRRDAEASGVCGGVRGPPRCAGLRCCAATRAERLAAKPPPLATT
mmetsp:Transcript_15856/g.55176  ORF Transcript_15856/g.55176 Transcript_15856/m.55176 type:complete len:496 (+) Transcript_15856:2272-3759(+)